ncbi:Uncharacterised protein [Mycobacterium tuberculosis]|nr:Uncharacterised protein [Mycobacterium tuberculosis]
MPFATRRKLSSHDTSCPATSMRPLFNGSTPIKLLNSVVLPMPLRPMMAMVSLALPSNEMPCRASLWP